MVARKCAAAAGFALLTGTAIAYAQQELVGAYQGSFEIESKTIGAKRGMPVLVGVKLEIVRVDGGKVTGTWHMLRGNCMGEYEVAGSHEGGRLVLQTGEGAKPGCGKFRLNFTVDGGKLAGKFGEREIVLSK